MLLSTAAFTLCMAAGLMVSEPPAAPQPPATEPPLLEGPNTNPPSLVQYDFRGNFVVLRDRPELAAVSLLDDPSIGEIARKQQTSRVAALGRLLAEHIDILRDATDAIRDGENKRAQDLQRQLYDLFEPAHRRDPLLQDLDDQLSDAQRAEVQRYLDDYWNNWIAWELRNRRDDMMSMDDLDAATRSRAQEQLSYRLFQQELNEAYRIAIQPLARRLERIYAAVTPSDEQRQAIREIMLDYVRETKLEPSDEARERATSRIFDLLDDAQRKRVMSYIMWGET